MRYLSLLLLSVTTAFVLTNTHNDLYVRNIYRRTVTGTLTKPVAAKPATPGIAAGKPLAPVVKQDTPKAGGNALGKPRQQSELSKTIAQKSRLLNPVIENRVQKDLAKEAEKNEKNALKHSKQLSNGGYVQAPRTSEERTLGGKPIYPKSQHLKDTFTAHNPFANKENKAAAKDRKLEHSFKKSPSDIEHEKKRNKLAEADNKRNKEYYENCRNKKEEFEYKTQKYKLGLETAATVRHLGVRDVVYVRKRIKEQHLLGRAILRRQACAV